MKNFIFKNKYLICIGLFIALNIAISILYIGYKPYLMEGDSVTYIEAAKFLQGENTTGQGVANRILSVPFFLYTTIFVDAFVDDLHLSISIVNLIFYIGCVYTFYLLSLEIYKENRVALLATMLVTFNYYVIDPVNAHLADMGGWFFFLLSTYFAVKYFNSTERKYYYAAIVYAAMGVLFKEYGGFGIINLGTLIVVSNFSYSKKIKDIFLAAVLFSPLLIFYHVFVYLKYNYSYFDWYSQVKTVVSVPGYESKSVILLLKILGWLFSFGWIAFLFGLKEECKVVDKNRIKILVALLPSTLFFLIWPGITGRLAVMFMMWLALIAGFGLSKLKWYALYPFIGAYVWFNCNILWLLEKINLPF